MLQVPTAFIKLAILIMTVKPAEIFWELSSQTPARITMKLRHEDHSTNMDVFLNPSTTAAQERPQSFQERSTVSNKD